MGNSEIKEENERLKKEIEEDLKKEEQLKEEKKKLEKEVKKLKNSINKKKIDLSPQEIQKLMEEKANLTDKYNNLNDKYNALNDKFQKLQTYCNNLTLDNNQTQAYCGQLQLMLLWKMQEMTEQQNLNNFNTFQNQSPFFQNQINGMINNQNFNNNINFQKQNNNINNNFINLNNNKNVITIMFNIDGKYKYPIVSLPEYKLRNIYLLLLNQIGNHKYSNINKLQFFYMSKNITNLFLNNNDVKSLNLNGNTPVIDVLTT